ncbi:MAG: long-subunit fatty acid transport protein, partial [Myxococcota bacterium]
MLLALLLASASEGLAGGYYYSDSGIVALGRGGAWVAGADTQFAQEYNPAGLVRIERPTINVGMSQIQQNVGFDRFKAEGGTYKTAENQAAPFLVPQLGFATPLPSDLAFAFGFYSP